MTQAGGLEDSDFSVDRLLLLLSSLSGNEKRRALQAAIRAVLAQQEVRPSCALPVPGWPHCPAVMLAPLSCGAWRHLWQGGAGCAGRWQGARGQRVQRRRRHLPQRWHRRCPVRAPAAAGGRAARLQRVPRRLPALPGPGQRVPPQPKHTEQDAAVHRARVRHTAGLGGALGSELVFCLNKREAARSASARAGHER